MNTYAWMAATALSRVVRIIGAGREKIFTITERFEIAFPNNVIRRWPAIRFAVSRTHNVIGRIRFLTSSIITIKFINNRGVPCGNKWDKKWFVFFIVLKIITDNQKVIASGRLINRWEVEEKICGYRAAMLAYKIKKNRVRIMISTLFSVFLSENLTSFLNVCVILFFTLLNEF